MHKVIAQNKRGYFDYFIEQKIEAGIALLGSEVKSIRKGNISIADAHAGFDNQELWLHNSHIAEYEQANRLNHNPIRRRKLLLHKREIRKILGKLKLKGYTLIALSVYFNNKNTAKVELGLARGKKQHDKRESIKAKEWNREKGRVLRGKE